jgi:hypothetical protein
MGIPASLSSFVKTPNAGRFLCYIYCLSNLRQEYGGSVFGLAGVDLRLNDTWSLVGQARYRWAEDELGGNFAGFGTIDLSGFDYTVGAAFHF